MPREQGQGYARIGGGKGGSTFEGGRRVRVCVGPNKLNEPVKSEHLLDVGWIRAANYTCAYDWRKMAGCHNMEFSVGTFGRVQ